MKKKISIQQIIALLSTISPDVGTDSTFNEFAIPLNQIWFLNGSQVESIFLSSEPEEDEEHVKQVQLCICTTCSEYTFDLYGELDMSKLVIYKQLNTESVFKVKESNPLKVKK
jgi:hypothetical protein